MFNFIHIELASRCQKACAMCGRRKLERDHPELCHWGDMSLFMVRELAEQIPGGTVVQMHNNGEPTVYPWLGYALQYFTHTVRQFNTNGILINKKAGEIIENLDVLTVSVIEKDPEGEAQYQEVRKFLDKKGGKAPRMVYRLLGKVEKPDRWYDLPGVVATRTLHAPEGSRRYRKKVAVPEIGICQDLLTHLAVDRYGDINLCVRFDPEKELKLGNIKHITLKQAWESAKRKRYLRNHIAGRRDLCAGCDKCEFWGVPIG